MARYFFRIEADFTSHDDDGAEFPSKKEALGEAAAILGKMLEDADGEMPVGNDLKVVVEDEFREPLFEIKARASDLKR